MEDTTRISSTRSLPAADQTAQAIEMIESLNRVSDLVRERVGSALGDTNLNETRLIVMRTIAACGDSGCSQAELATVLRQAESSVCTLIERMKKDGLVHRFRSKLDRRKSFLMLTPGGQEQLQDALRKYRTAAVNLQDVWGTDLSSALCSLLDNMIFSLERPAAVAPVSAPKAA